MKNLITLFLALFWVLTLQAQTYYPNQQWERKAPDEVSINKEKLDEAVQFALDHEYSGEKDLRLAILKAFSREPGHRLQGPTKERGSPAGLVIKDGFIIAEWGDLDRVDMTFSVTKSYLSTVAGLAIEDSLITQVTDPVNQYVWDDTFDGDHNAKITWEHLLHQTSDWSGNLFGLDDWADRPDRNQSIDEWKNRALHAPGSHFKYNDVRVNVLSYCLLQVVRQPLPQLLKQRVMDPINASTTWRWMGYEDSWMTMDGQHMQVVSGGGHHGGGMFISTLDQARFGLLFARNGQWNDQQLISSDWVQKIRTPAAAFESYGYMWWLNQGPRAWEDTPEHLYYAAGFGGNFIIIDDQRDLVIVTRWLEPSEVGALVRKVYDAF